MTQKRAKNGRKRDSNPHLSASQTTENPEKPLCQVAVEVTSLVWDVAVEATSFKTDRICQFIGLQNLKQDGNGISRRPLKVQK